MRPEDPAPHERADLPPLPESEPPPARRNRSRANWIPSARYFLLEQACEFVSRAFDEHGFGVYLVGSSLERSDYRDVDVRVILSDDAFERLFPGAHTDPPKNALWSLMCASISLMLSNQSGLPVDFQIQQQSRANAMEGQTVRSALGIFVGYPGGG